MSAPEELWLSELHFGRECPTLSVRKVHEPWVGVKYIPAAKAEADLAAVQRECERRKVLLERAAVALRHGTNGGQLLIASEIDAALTPNPSPNDTRPHAV